MNVWRRHQHSEARLARCTQALNPLHRGNARPHLPGLSDQTRRTTAMSKPLRLGIAGLGTVGVGVLRILRQQAAL